MLRLALRHLTRTQAPEKISTTDGVSPAPENSTSGLSLRSILHESAQTPTITGTPEILQKGSPFVSALNPDVTVRICTFSPCIEQVTRTVLSLRELGWVDIEVMTMAHKRIEVRRERLGTHEERQRGARAIPATVEEAVERLRESDIRLKLFHAQADTDKNGSNGDAEVTNDTIMPLSGPSLDKQINGLQPISNRKAYKEGRLVHRAEPELKTHTSYLVFAILPREWTPEDERKALARWPFKSESGTKGTHTTVE